MKYSTLVGVFVILASGLPGVSQGKVYFQVNGMPTLSEVPSESINYDSSSGALVANISTPLFCQSNSSAIVNNPLVLQLTDLNGITNNYSNIDFVTYESINDDDFAMSINSTTSTSCIIAPDLDQINAVPPGGCANADVLLSSGFENGETSGSGSCLVVTLATNGNGAVTEGLLGYFAVISNRSTFPAEVNLEEFYDQQRPGIDTYITAESSYTCQIQSLSGSVLGPCGLPSGTGEVDGLSLDIPAMSAAKLSFSRRVSVCDSTAAEDCDSIYVSLAAIPMTNGLFVDPDNSDNAMSLSIDIADNRAPYFCVNDKGPNGQVCDINNNNAFTQLDFSGSVAAGITLPMDEDFCSQASPSACLAHWGNMNITAIDPEDGVLTSNWTASYNGSDGQVSIDTNGSNLNFIPAPDYFNFLGNPSGPSSLTFTLQVEDGDGISSELLVNAYVKGINDPPTIRDGFSTFVTTAGSGQIIDIFAPNYSVIDPAGRIDDTGKIIINADAASFEKGLNIGLTSWFNAQAGPSNESGQSLTVVEIQYIPFAGDIFFSDPTLSPIGFTCPGSFGTSCPLQFFIRPGASGFAEFTVEVEDDLGEMLTIGPLRIEIDDAPPVITATNLDTIDIFEDNVSPNDWATQWSPVIIGADDPNNANTDIDWSAQSTGVQQACINPQGFDSTGYIRTDIGWVRVIGQGPSPVIVDYLPCQDSFGNDQFELVATSNNLVVTQTVQINVASVNDQPSFLNSSPNNIKRGPLPSTSPEFEIDWLLVSECASNGSLCDIDLGALNESNQGISFAVTSESSYDILDEVNAGVFFEVLDNAQTGQRNGRFRMNGNPGQAILGVEVVDGGSTANGGEDTSELSEFTIDVCVQTPDTLITWLPFDEDSGLSDIAVTGFDGESNPNGFNQVNVFNGVSTVLGGGQVKDALQLDGVDDYISLGDDDEFDIAASENIAFSMWVNPGSSFFTSTILSKLSTAGYRLRMSNTGNLIFMMQDGVDMIEVTSTNSLTLDEWSHVAVSVDWIAQTVVIHINENREVFGSITSLASLENASDVFIGSNEVGMNLFTGFIDELQYFSDALILGATSSDDQAVIFHTAGRAGQCRSPVLLYVDNQPVDILAIDLESPVVFMPNVLTNEENGTIFDGATLRLEIESGDASQYQLSVKTSSTLSIEDGVLRIKSGGTFHDLATISGGVPGTDPLVITFLDLIGRSSGREANASRVTGIAKSLTILHSGGGLASPEIIKLRASITTEDRRQNSTVTLLNVQ